jgi:hypothetical protein
MNSQDYRNLQEAYLDVYELDEVSQQLKTRAFKNRATREFESDGDNPKDFTKSGASKADKTKENIVKKHGRAAGEHAERAAHTGIFGRKSFSMPKKPVKEGFDLYDIILSHLIAEGYADTEQAAEAIMVNMSEEWRESIVVEGYKEIDREKHGRMYDRYKKLGAAALKDARETGEASGDNRFKMSKMMGVIDKSAENLRNKR